MTKKPWIKILEDQLLQSTWDLHRPCHECTLHWDQPATEWEGQEHFCCATKLRECPEAKGAIANYIEENFDPDEVAFFEYYNLEDDLLAAQYTREFPNISLRDAQRYIDIWKAITQLQRSLK